MKYQDNHKQSNIDGAEEKTSNNTLPAKIKAGLLGLTPATVFRISLVCSVLVLAAGIIWHTATDDLHVS